jgi:hypothetical protein
MSWKRVWNDWGSVAVALAVCLGTLVLYLQAWHVGHAASAIGLLGCHLLRLPLLLFAWLAVSSEFKTVAGPQGIPVKPRFSVLDFAGSLIIFVGCFGCYPVWPFVLGLLAVPLVFAMKYYGKGTADPAATRRIRQALLSVAISVALFTLTWYLSAATTRQALHGLGQRIEDKGGADKLLTWAKGLIADTKQKKQPPRLERKDLPDWLEDMLGRFEGVRSVGVQDYGDEACVALRTGGSAYHFRIDVCPSERERARPPWWAGEGNGLAWRPGIYLDIEGK